MTEISLIVREALQVGYLTIESEERLRQLYDRGVDLEDLLALTRLQKAANCGIVKLLSQELRVRQYNQIACKCIIEYMNRKLRVNSSN